MLNLHTGEKFRTCDGVNRRGFIQLGALGATGFTLAHLLAAEAQAGPGASRHKAIINVNLRGGPSHQDMFDLKPEAPAEFRGEFAPIATNVPGFQICEHYPKLAKMADKFAVVRSLIGADGGHGGNQVQVAYNAKKAFTNIGGPPSIGAFVSKLQGATPSGAPPWVAFDQSPYGYLGPTHRGYKPDNNGGRLRLARDLTKEQLSDRTQLLNSIDNLRRDMDRSGSMEALDAYTQRAYEMVISGKVADALDLNKEDPAVVARYDKAGEELLKSRRLIEAGVRVITLKPNWGNWDTHGQNFTKLRNMLPKMDTGLSALLWDLERTGLIDDVMVVAWGEFGRTPKITGNGKNAGGRNHWPRVSMAWIAGGGLNTGQAIGATDRIAGEAVERPIHYHEVFSTMYHHLGIDAEKTSIIDPSGRPQFLVDSQYRAPIAELV